MQPWTGAEQATLGARAQAHTSSMRMTGDANRMTSSHSWNVSGTMPKMLASTGTYKMRKCKPKETASAASSHGLIQGGIVSSELSCGAHVTISACRSGQCKKADRRSERCAHSRTVWFHL